MKPPRGEQYEWNCARIETTLRNLRRAAGCIDGNRLYRERPLAGVPAFVIGAGSSLDRNVALLPEAAKRGAIFATNTATAAVLRHVVPDVTMILEAQPLAWQLRAAAEAGAAVVLTDHAHPDCYSLPALRVLVRNMRGFFSEAIALATTEVINVGAAATAAASLWGASPVVLLGFGADPQAPFAYATGTPWDHTTHDVVGGVVRTGGHPERDAYARDVGGRFVREHRAVTMPAWGGGTITTTSELARGALGIGHFAARHGHPIINASEAGYAIPGVPERHLADVLASLPERAHRFTDYLAATPPITAGEARAEHAARVRGLRNVADICRTFLYGQGQKRDRAADHIYDALRAERELEYVSYARVVDRPPREQARVLLSEALRLIALLESPLPQGVEGADTPHHRS